MEFFAFHGVLPEEREKGNDFAVELEYDYESCCAVSDSLEQAVDYGEVYSIVEKVMKVPHMLLESIAADICDLTITAFPSILRVEVTVKKKNPPIGGKCSWSAVKTFALK